MLPGFVNAHSHAFQRVLRGRVEGGAGDFWSWRERMYHAALRLEPEDVRIASRMAFLEMLLAGFTGVVEFHYLHRDPAGESYAEPDAMAHAVLEAARETGIRICLLETAYARGGPDRGLDPAQRRFADSEVGAFVERAERVEGHIQRHVPEASFGLALHSVRALPREWLAELARWADEQRSPGSLPVHMHVAEQPAEVETCLAEHGRRPVELLTDIGLLNPAFTAIHAIHVNAHEIGLLAAAGARVCLCPSTEANLGDGFAPAAALARAGIPLCVGTDSHAAIDPFAELRELDYRERLRSGRREGLAPAGRLLDVAAAGGSGSAGWEGGALEAGRSADLVVLDGQYPTLAGARPGTLAAHLLVAGSAALVRDVYVGGKQVVAEGRHPAQEEIVAEFAALQRRLWAD